jgi:hypothetical protein
MARDARALGLVGYGPLPLKNNHARINCEAFTANQPLPNGASQDALEHATEQITLV